MVDENEEKSATGFTQIKPAAINLTTNSSSESSVKPNRHTKRYILIGTGFVALLVMASIVIFLLPNWIRTPVVEPSQVTSATETKQVTPASSHPRTKTAESPWERAQQSKLRKETQEILSQMLDAQKTLEGHGVSEWAADEYAQAMQFAQAGDVLYNERDFVQARVEYEQTLIILNELVDRVDEVFEEMMTTGEKALTDNDAAAAKEAFRIALAIDSIDRAANIGRERAETLDDVLALLITGDNLLEQGKLDEAKMIYQQALELDNHSNQAKQQIQLTEKRILDREFNNHMSSGFSALENNRLENARQAFNRALKLKPKSFEARSALDQVKHKITTNKINSLLAQGKKLEQEERWHDAVAKYNAALSLDNVLADAQQGKQRATVRAKIHDRLEQILSHPERIFDHDVYDETVNFHQKLRALSNPGPVLKKQLIALTVLLTKASTPVTINLQSDNLTKVTLYRVGELGYFTNKEISVRPGNYVAVGHRDGYRDVRVEFSVKPDKPTSVINIRAVEKIALGN